MDYTHSMAYTPPEYPSTIPSTNDLPEYVDDLDWVYATHGNALRKELRAVMIELGVLPKGDAVNVGARIASLLPHFNDRGDPASPDWELTDLTEDGAWHDLDLSSIVPVNTKLVLLKVDYRATAAGKTMLLRKNGNSNSINMQEIRAQVANEFLGQPALVSCDNDRVIEYLLASPETTGVYISVRGWWK